VETSSFFIIYPYSRVVSLNIPFFSKKLSDSIYLFPKYRLSNNFFFRNYHSPDFYVLYSEMLSFKKIFKFVNVFHFFWIYLFLFSKLPKSSFKNVLNYSFSFLLFTRSFIEEDDMFFTGDDLVLPKSTYFFMLATLNLKKKNTLIKYE